MDQKPLIDRLKNYNRIPEDNVFFDNIRDYKILTDVDNRKLIIEADLSKIVDKVIIIEIEKRLKTDYSLNSAQIITRYPSELFSSVQKKCCEQNIRNRPC